MQSITMTVHQSIVHKKRSVYSRKEIVKEKKSNTRLNQNKRKFGSLFCSICNKEDSHQKISPPGSFHAMKKNVDNKHKGAYQQVEKCVNYGWK